MPKHIKLMPFEDACSGS